MAMRLADVIARTALVCWCLVTLPTASANSPSKQLSLTPYQADGIYELGERVGWTVKPPSESFRGKCVYTVKKNNFELIDSGELDLSSGHAEIALTLNEPAMIFAEVSLEGGSSPKYTVVAGAAIAPRKLQPVVPRPPDFDKFWARHIERLKQVRPDPLVTHKEAGRTGVQYATIRLDHVDGGHVHGQYAKPEGDGSHPAMLILQWAESPVSAPKRMGYRTRCQRMAGTQHTSA